MCLLVLEKWGCFSIKALLKSYFFVYCVIMPKEVRMLYRRGVVGCEGGLGLCMMILRFGKMCLNWRMGGEGYGGV